MTFAKSLLGSIGLGALLVGCGFDSSNGPGDRDWKAEVGDPIDGGRVTHVQAGGDCQIVTVSYEAEWECTPEQLSLVNGSSSVPGYGGAVGAAPSVSKTAELIPTDCEGLAALRRPELKAAQRQSLDANVRNLLSQKCFAHTGVKYYSKGAEVTYCTPPPMYSSGVGGTGTYPSAGLPSYSSGATTTGPSPSNPQLGGMVEEPTDSDEGASDYSTTNTQVVGVDEADFVKNDAEHVYVLSGQSLHIIDAWPALETKEIKRVPIPGEPRRLFLANDKLVVYTRLGVTGTGAPPSAQGCTYGYDCRFSAEPGQTMVIVYDVKDASNPRELRRFAFSGNYVDSRRIGPYVYTVVQDGDQASLPGLDLSLHADSATELAEQYALRCAQADAAIDDAPAADFLPWVRRFDEAGNMAEDVSSCDNALASQAAHGKSFVSLIAIDLETLDPPSRTLIAGKPGYVYASDSALYLATDGVDGSDFIYRQQGQADQSTVHKFAFDGTTTSYRGSSTIPGHVLNQFSMDEQDGVLRLATSSGWVPDPSVSSNLLTLAEQDGTLQQLGRIGNIAPTEDIRSVRFDGTRAFVVTFKKTDPLFVFDLTEPAAPKQLGELKIPGFSTYMHPIDHDHLLAIGFDADDHGSFAYFDGIQLQIFDVSELSNPKLLHKTIIGTRGSASEALTNHLAFNYFPQKGMLALPMSVCEGGDDGKYGDKLTFSGLMVFDVSLETGIKEHGRMPFVDTASVSSSFAAGQTCSTWWASSTSDVKRSIFMDDYAIGISDTLYQVAPLATLDQVAQKLPLSQ